MCHKSCRLRYTCCLISIWVTFCCSSWLMGTVNASEKVVYLTFDDGPSQRYTPLILDVLRHEHVRATFFVLGSRCAEFPQIVRRIHSDGHEIGNHGYYHESIVHKSDQWVQADILNSDRVIRQVCGESPLYYRPPGGLINQTEVHSIGKLGHPIALWTVDSRDWNAKSAQDIEENIETQVRAGSIVLLHDGVSNSRLTAEALPAIIQQLKTHGFSFSVLPPSSSGLPAAVHTTKRYK
jgi:peptidoglycan/xylan/chitin deacetylase (PgdA/CDA1 family)